MCQTFIPVSRAATDALQSIFENALLPSVFRPLCAELIKRFPDAASGANKGLGFRANFIARVAAEIEDDMEKARAQLGPEATTEDIRAAFEHTANAKRKVEVLEGLKSKATNLGNRQQLLLDYKYGRINDDLIRFKIPAGTSIINLIDRVQELIDAKGDPDAKYPKIVFPALLEQLRNEPVYTQMFEEPVSIIIQALASGTHSQDKAQQIATLKSREQSMPEDWQLVAAILLHYISSDQDLCAGNAVRTNGRTLSFSLVGLTESFYLDIATNPRVVASVIEECKVSL